MTLGQKNCQGLEFQEMATAFQLSSRWMVAIVGLWDQVLMRGKMTYPLENVAMTSIVNRQEV